MSAVYTASRHSGVNVTSPGEQLLGDGGEAQTLLHHVDRGEEGRGDVLLGLPLLAQGLESAELVERMERLGYASSVLLARPH